MLITLKKGASIDDVGLLTEKLNHHGLQHHLSKQKDQMVIGLEKNISDQLLEELSQHACIVDVVATSSPLKLASLEYQKERTIIRIGDVEIGGDRIVIMAGPCAIESEKQLLTIASHLKRSGVSIMRGSAFKPRTSPYSFQGLGVEGLKMHKKMQKEHGLLIETEVMDVRHVKLVEEHVDILRIGARNMQNFDLLKEVGKCQKPVILKRGMSATIHEWLLCAEYIMAHGNPNVILCERGIRTFETATRSTLDLSSVAVVKRLTHLPVIVDPSHAAGRKDIIPDLCMGAIAMNADGLLVEVHHVPEDSTCDANQALTPEEFHHITRRLKPIAAANGRSL